MCLGMCVCEHATAEHHITRSCSFSGSIGLKVEKSMGVRICWAKQKLLQGIDCTVRNKLACIIRGSGKSPIGMPLCTEICSRHFSLPKCWKTNLLHYEPLGKCFANLVSFVLALWHAQRMLASFCRKSPWQVAKGCLATKCQWLRAGPTGKRELWPNARA